MNLAQSETPITPEKQEITGESWIMGIVQVNFDLPTAAVGINNHPLQHE
jgi:hypothetical protein